MCNRQISYPKVKKGFPWLVYIKENSKEMALVLSEVIMGDSDIFWFWL